MGEHGAEPERSEGEAGGSPIRKSSRLSHSIEIQYNENTSNYILLRRGVPPSEKVAGLHTPRE